MKVYFAGAENYLPLLQQCNAKNILIAYPFFKKKNFTQESFKDFNLFLDSGAFSVYSGTEKINIETMIQDYKKLDWIKAKCGLDVIGNGEETLKNLDYMKAQGLDVIPTFHFKSDFKYFEYYCKNYKYVALGGTVPYKHMRNDLIEWFDTCFAIAKDYWPIKLHAFGVNNWQFIKRYPFYSIDATSWHNPHRWGQHFKFEKGLMKRLTIKDKPINVVYDKDQQLTDSITQWLEAEKYITKLWQSRGIDFEN